MFNLLSIFLLISNILCYKSLTKPVVNDQLIFKGIYFWQPNLIGRCLIVKHEFSFFLVLANFWTAFTSIVNLKIIREKS